MPPFIFYLFSLLILLRRVTPDPPEEEKTVLLTFFTKLPHDPSYNWIASESPCSWKGVFCDPTNTTVIQLSLPNAKLTGEIPPDTIGKLSNLLVLSLKDNNLNGTIPSEFYYLPLNELYLQNNRFSGYLRYINSDGLEKLDVSNNDFNCSIPNWLSKFPESTFSSNKNLCGFPLNSCHVNLDSCPRYYRMSGNRISVKERVTFVFLAGLGLVVLVSLYCLRKKVHQQSKQPPKPPLQAPEGGMQEEKGRNKLVLFDDGDNEFDCDELMQGSAEVLGKGSYGVSYKRVLEEKMVMVVVKRLKDVAVTEVVFESKTEVLGKMKNENVVPLRGYYYWKDEKWLVFYYMPAGSLSAHLHGSRGLSGTRLDWNHRMSIALSAAKGLAYLHDCNVVHGNIKSSNVLLRHETNKDAMVSDYGLTTLFDMWSSPNHWVTGYWAPEVLRNKMFSLKSDVYSFGVLILELLTGKAPNQAWTNRNDFPMWVQFVVCEEPKDEIFDVELRNDQNMKEIIQMLQTAKVCVSIVPDQRPTMLKVVSMMEEMKVVKTIIG